jgi:DNA-binding transcriptional LysR family regulator
MAQPGRRADATKVPPFTLVLRHHAHGLALTGAGRAFHAELRAFLAHSQELADTAANAGQALVGDLTAGYFLSLFAERGLEPLIRHRSTGFETVRALVAAGEGSRC